MKNTFGILFAVVLTVAFVAYQLYVWWRILLLLVLVTICLTVAFTAFELLAAGWKKLKAAPVGAQMKQKPIRVFWSPLSQRFYASRAYKQLAAGMVEITGEKFDVTDDISSIVERYKVEFKPAAHSMARQVEQKP